jgi:hypothetical protein
MCIFLSVILFHKVMVFCTYSESSINLRFILYIHYLKIQVISVNFYTVILV